MNDNGSPEERFDQSLRDWAARPTRTLPDEAAAAVVAAVVDRRAHRRRGLAVAAAAACVLAVGAAVLVRGTHPRRVVHEAGVVLATPVLHEGQALIWIDDETPLYMTFAAPGSGAR